MPARTPDDDSAPGAALELACRVQDRDAGEPLLDYLIRRFPYHDRAAWLVELRAGRITLDGRAAAAEQRLRAGARLVYRKLHREPDVPLALPVLYDDADLLVVDKPALLPMHADGPFVRNTLIHVVRTALGLPGASLVHRLDRETSGLVLIAKHEPARVGLQAQFAAGTVGKLYRAVVAGAVASDFCSDAPIGHAAHSSIALRRSAAADAVRPRAARTEFTVERRGADRSLLRCAPRTGRTHQIRVHLEHAGHPVLGDKLYGQADAAYLAFVAHVKAGGAATDAPPHRPGRQLLHAAELTFQHPRTGAPQHVVAPLPEDFQAWLP